jgi:S-adenosylmethionine decarboxylase
MGINMRKNLGNHFLFDYEACDIKKIYDNHYLENGLKNILINNGCHIISQNSHSFSPQGATIFFILSESHVALHTWPEYQAACLDVYLCISPEKGFQIGKDFSKLVGSVQYEKSFLERGKNMDIEKCA